MAGACPENRQFQFLEIELSFVLVIFVANA
jgi:hypothetical protein